MLLVRINAFGGLEDAVGPGRMVGTRDHRLTADSTDRCGNLFMVRGHPDGRQIGSNRPFPHMLNHRLAGNICKWLSG